MTDDYLQTDISGVVQDKQTWLKNYFIPLAELIKAGKFRWDVFDENDVEIRIHGDSAIVVGALDAKGSGARFDIEQHTWVADPNASFEAKLRFTRVYIRRDGKWAASRVGERNSGLTAGPPTPFHHQSLEALSRCCLATSKWPFNIAPYAIPSSPSAPLLICSRKNVAITLEGTVAKMNVVAPVAGWYRVGQTEGRVSPSRRML